MKSLQIFKETPGFNWFSSFTNGIFVKKSYLSHYLRIVKIGEVNYPNWMR
ncbi:hypothetical protein bcere0026_6730 [Bacillus mycoides]|uniref:Uncharacterized protein n=1 Tax=Bacillus mycoides TaxID=1405 RepID=C2XPS0_BACMY|nr:hypothetical protein bcere0026_6730 [Bacillus mycoides]